jgi:hypothetical protein
LEEAQQSLSFLHVGFRKTLSSSFLVGDVCRSIDIASSHSIETFFIVPSNLDADSMEDRLHGIADSFRRERDDALRRKMTAQERLTLKKQEVDAMATTLKNLQDKQKQLKVHMSKAEQNEELRKEVLQLTKEVSVMKCV